jgi:hypothetical protein
MPDLGSSNAGICAKLGIGLTFSNDMFDLKIQDIQATLPNIVIPVETLSKSSTTAHNDTLKSGYHSMAY